ncbi:MAG: DUF3843 family protein [Prevotella sp.]|nr:DUF3843 family protein [Prevotella sp.]
MMKKNPAVLVYHLHHSHPDNASYSTDGYYLRLANQLLSDFIRSRIYIGESTSSMFHYAAISLACYLEDIVADSGQWRAFSALCQQMFGWPVPIYHDDAEEYYPDEPSLMAVRYLIYNAATEIDDIWWKPETPELDQLARIAYQRINAAFEEAPVNDELTADIDAMLDRAGRDFIAMRPALIWLFSNCYITASVASEKILMKVTNDIKQLSDITSEESKQHFITIMHCIFAYKIGPLALYPKDYLAALMRTRGKHTLASDVEAIEVLPQRTYRYAVDADGQSLTLECVDGSVLQVARDEFTLDDKQLAERDGCKASFVSYQGAWHLNGVMAVLHGTSARWEELCEKDSDHLPEGCVTADADWYLERTGGRQLFFFANTDEMKEYVRTRFHFNEEACQSFDQHHFGDEPVMMFIDKSEPKNCLQFSYGFTPCVAAPDNPFYDADTARQEAIEMLWNDDSVSTGAMLYLLDHGYLPEVLTDDLICQNGTRRDRDADARFLLRYMRRENY